MPNQHPSSSPRVDDGYRMIDLINYHRMSLHKTQGGSFYNQGILVLHLSVAHTLPWFTRDHSITQPGHLVPRWRGGLD